MKSGNQRYLQEFLVPTGPVTLVAGCTWLLPEVCLTPGGLSLAEVQDIAVYCCCSYSQVCQTWSSSSLRRGRLASLGPAQHLSGWCWAWSPACQGDWLTESSADTLPHLLYLPRVGASCLDDAHRTGWLFETYSTHSHCRGGSPAVPGWTGVDAMATRPVAPQNPASSCLSAISPAHSGMSHCLGHGFPLLQRAPACTFVTC